MQYRGPMVLIVLATAVLAACSGTTPTAIPSQTQSISRAAQGLGGGGVPTPVPAALQPLAPVDLVANGAASAVPTFALTNSWQCFSTVQSSANTGDGGDEHQHNYRETDRYRSHHNDDGGDGSGSTQQFGNPYTPASDTVLFFGGFSLTDPCAAGSLPRHGHREEDASRRHVQNIVTPPPVGGGAFIVAVDSADAAKTQVPVDGPASYDASTGTYTFGSARVSWLFRANHTYTFALAAPAKPTPVPTPTRTPRPEGDD